MASGTMCLAMEPAAAPPHACWMAALSTMKLAALRTLTSSNGARVVFIVMNHVRSAELALSRSLRAASCAYSDTTVLGGVSGEPSSWPCLILSKMSWVFVLMSTVTLSTLAERYSASSVAGS